MAVTFSIPRGGTKTMSLIVKNSRGVVQDITGMTIVVAVKRNPDDREEELTTKSTAVGAEGSITDGPAGLAELYFDPVDTEDLAPDTYTFDGWATLGGARWQIIPPSKFVVTGRVLDTDGA